MRKGLIFILFGLFFTSILCGQDMELKNNVLLFEDYLELVKKFHPVAKQAYLIEKKGDANLLKSRGGFDPKVEVDFNQKVFKDTEYYNLLNATFKVPTWYGVELKAQFEENAGYYLNPQNNVPENGLYAAGISVSLAQGLWINERMATLKQARVYQQQLEADQDLAINQIIFEAATAYFDWIKAYNQVNLYENFLENAEIRFSGIKSSALAGAIPLIDTTEAKISVQNRQLSLQGVQLDYQKSRLELANYLWLNDNIPVELQQDIKPEENLRNVVEQALKIESILAEGFETSEHPKIKSLDFKIQGLDIERRLKSNKLLPTLDVDYNFITSTPELANSFQVPNYKAGLTFKMPLFLRKERGDLALSQLKVQDANFELDNAKIQLQNKITAVYVELSTLIQQNNLVEEVVINYETMLKAEERKYQVGESSIFLINTRETNLIEARLKAIEITNKLYTAKAKLFNTLAIDPTDL
ncbi:TolC family protein [Flavimarina sp. Hel_I_48]|uniref:TolC family protein n=1 Tax=Flavimarina sp. Hel_I_48 TaxID=1392488 RepID=UPI0004DED050|nr:TolC family protein [Flavimarina sp. Hel_I_48]